MKNRLLFLITALILSGLILLGTIGVMVYFVFFSTEPIPAVYVAGDAFGLAISFCVFGSALLDLLEWIEWKEVTKK